jgi:mannose-6-phosphate isomerase
LVAQQKPLQLDTCGESFHALTVIEGRAEVICGGEKITLDRFETVVVSADAGAYRLNPISACRVLSALVPPSE